MKREPHLMLLLTRTWTQILAFPRETWNKNRASICIIAACGLVTAGVSGLVAEPHNTREQAKLVTTAQAILDTEDTTRLWKFCQHDDPLVRALVARRVATVSLKRERKDRQDERALNTLNVLLVDHHELVRANALIAARQIGYHPQSILKGLIVDRRDAVDISELSDAIDPRAEALRNRYRFPPLGRAATDELAKALFNQLEPQQLSIALLPPIRHRESIGWLAAESLIDSDKPVALQFLQDALPILSDNALATAIESFIADNRTPSR